MKAMILAAGRGNRLRPLTDQYPKPLIRVGHNTLIEHHIKKLATAGFESIVINTTYLGEQIHNRIGDGTRYNIPIHYSDEGASALETGGGIAYALPLLGDEPFLLVSADIYCAIPFSPSFILSNSRMHLVMVSNPPHHSEGDFVGNEIGLIKDPNDRFTYSGVSYIDPQLFIAEKRTFPLIEKIRYCITENIISANLFTGAWFDVGTGSRLHTANKYALSN